MLKKFFVICSLTLCSCTGLQANEVFNDAQQTNLNDEVSQILACGKGRHKHKHRHFFACGNETNDGVLACGKRKRPPETVLACGKGKRPPETVLVCGKGKRKTEVVA